MINNSIACYRRLLFNLLQTYINSLLSFDTGVVNKFNVYQIKIYHIYWFYMLRSIVKYEKTITLIVIALNGY